MWAARIPGRERIGDGRDDGMTGAVLLAAAKKAAVADPVRAGPVPMADSAVRRVEAAPVASLSAARAEIVLPVRAARGSLAAKAAAIAGRRASRRPA